MEIRKVGVVGCGLMGSGIAQVSAQANFPTVVREVTAELLEKGMGSIRKFLQGGVEKGKMSAGDMEKTLANLKGTLAEFARRIFGRDRKVAFKCDYFPFVEPGMELRIDCFICRGEGRLPDGQPCRTCGHSGWIEILGAGMVHPEIIANAGYDAERYTGFAFGMGLERMAMLRHGVNDIKYYYEGDIRFLEQF